MAFSCVCQSHHRPAGAEPAPSAGPSLAGPSGHGSPPRPLGPFPGLLTATLRTRLSVRPLWVPFAGFDSGPHEEGRSRGPDLPPFPFAGISAQLTPLPVTPRLPLHFQPRPLPPSPLPTAPPTRWVVGPLPGPAFSSLQHSCPDTKQQLPASHTPSITVNGAFPVRPRGPSTSHDTLPSPPHAPFSLLHKVYGAQRVTFCCSLPMASAWPPACPLPLLPSHPESRARSVLPRVPGSESEERRPRPGARPHVLRERVSQAAQGAPSAPRPAPCDSTRHGAHGL